VRAYPRPGRVIQRLGNNLPEVSGEIMVRRVVRESTDPGMGIHRLGVRTFAVGTGCHETVVATSPALWREE